jgi:hypothetical protein
LGFGGSAGGGGGGGGGRRRFGLIGAMSARAPALLAANAAPASDKAKQRLLIMAHPPVIRERRDGSRSRLNL